MKQRDLGDYLDRAPVTPGLRAAIVDAAPGRWLDRGTLPPEGDTFGDAAVRAWIAANHAEDIAEAQQLDLPHWQWQTRGREFQRAYDLFMELSQVTRENVERLRKLAEHRKPGN